MRKYDKNFERLQYDTGYMLAVCYFLYSIEENKTEKTQLWKECLKYYKMLGTNEIEEHCGDFLVEYIQKETSSMEEVLSNRQSP